MKVTSQIGRHLEENELLAASNLCPFCASERRKPIFRLQTSPEVFLLKCEDCYAASASRMPTESALRKFYGDYYTTACPRSGDGLRLGFEDPARLAAHLAARMIRHLPRPSIRILDFGGGDGTVALMSAQQLLRHGFDRVDIVVVDYNNTLADNADKRITLVRREALDGLTSDYDFVIASAVIEHIPSAGDTLVRLLNLIAAGGLFYARTPFTIPLARMLRPLGVKMDFTFPGHVHDLGCDFWNEFFTKPDRGAFTLLESHPSLVETSLSKHLVRTMIALMFKAPWHLFGNSYRLVGGWEVFVRKG